MDIFDYDRNVVNYNGKEYPFRTVWCEEYKCDVIVSVTSLNYEVYDKYENWPDSLAEYIDSKIIFFVNEDEIFKSDYYLENVIKEIMS